MRHRATPHAPADGSPEPTGTLSLRAAPPWIFGGRLRAAHAVRGARGSAREAPAQPGLLKMSVPFVPPNPNEFDIATSIFMSRAVWGT